MIKTAKYSEAGKESKYNVLVLTFLTDQAIELNVGTIKHTNQVTPVIIPKL